MALNFTFGQTKSNNRLWLNDVCFAFRHKCFLTFILFRCSHKQCRLVNTKNVKYLNWLVEAADAIIQIIFNQNTFFTSTHQIYLLAVDKIVFQQ